MVRNNEEKRSEYPQSPTHSPRVASEDDGSQIVGRAEHHPAEVEVDMTGDSCVSSITGFVGQLYPSPASMDLPYSTSRQQDSLCHNLDAIEDKEATVESPSQPHPADNLSRTSRPSPVGTTTGSLVTMERALLEKGVVPGPEEDSSKSQAASQPLGEFVGDTPELMPSKAPGEGYSSQLVDGATPLDDKEQKVQQQQHPSISTNQAGQQLPGEFVGDMPQPIPLLPQAPARSSQPGAYAETYWRLRRPPPLSRNSNPQGEQPTASTDRISNPEGEQQRTASTAQMPSSGNNDGGFAVANPITDSDASIVSHPSQDLPRAENYDEAAAVERRRKYARARIGGGIMVVLVFLVAVAAIVTPLALRERTETDYDKRREPTPAPISNLSEADNSTATSSDFSLLSLLPEETAHRITSDPDSPQAKTFLWLLGDPLLPTYPDKLLKQKFALATVYHATGGDNWNNNTNWLRHDVNECDWFNKPDFGLKGALSKIYQVHSNWLPGFAETTPSRHCDEDGLYQHLWLDRNNLVGSIPTELYMLTSLQTLSFGANLIEGTISSYIGRLTALEGISWAGMHLTGTLPTEVGLLKDLEVLMLGRNSLSGSIPSEIWTLTNMMHLAFFGNRELTGTLPTEIGNWDKITWLPFPQFGLHGTIPTEIGKCVSLEVAYMDNCLLSGTIPSEIGLLHKKLWLLHLHDNSLDGSLPTELGLLTSTTSLSMSGNRLNGSVPSEIGLLTELAGSLRLKDNEIGKTIPSELGLLTHLYELDISNNQITGHLPSELAQLSSVDHLNFANNSISGTVPQALKESLRALNLTGNPGLSGAIPTGLCNINATCAPNPWDTALCSSPVGLSFDCTSLLCGCDCLCL